MPVKCASSFTFECVSVAVYLSRRSSVTVLTGYRPPATYPVSFVDCFDGVLNNLSQTAARKICLVGDFNAKHSAWLSSQDTDIAGMRMFAFAATNGLLQTVPEPTYSTVSGNEVLLNLMFTDQPGLVQSCCVLPPVSDHCPTMLILQAQHSVKLSCPSKGYSTWNYTGADYGSLREAFRQVDWSSLEKFPDPTEAVPM